MADKSGFIRIAFFGLDEQSHTRLYTALRSDLRTLMVGTLLHIDQAHVFCKVVNCEVIVVGAGETPRTTLAHIAALHRAMPNCRLLVYGGSADEHWRDQVIEAGAWGIIKAEGDEHYIRTAVRQVAQGELWLNGTTGG